MHQITITRLVVKNLLSAVLSQVASVNDMGPRAVYNISQTSDGNGTLTAEITSSLVFDENMADRLLNWEVGGYYGL